MREFVKESLGDMEIEGTDYQNVVFYNTEPAELIVISAWFPLHKQDFRINVPRESWRVNDFSLALHGVVVFCSKQVTGMYSFKNCNVFIDLAVKL